MPRTLLLSLACLLMTVSVSAQLNKNEIPPAFTGGNKAFNKLMYDSLRYPRSAAKLGVGGEVVVKFVVNSSGNVQNVSIVKSVHEDIDAEAMRVVALTSGKWKPGMQDGKAVSVEFNLPVRFRPHGVVLDDVETGPAYPGGEGAQEDFIYRSLRYPKQAVKDGIEGLVLTQFKIDADGKVSDIIITKGLREDIDNEALRILNKMRSWKPAKQNGQAVPVTFMQPIQFTITPAMRPLKLPEGPTRDEVYH